MRISTFQMHQQAATQIQALGEDAASKQNQIAHGKRLVNPGDDPIGVARVVGIRQEMAARDQFVRNTDAADVQLGLEESILKNITDVLHRVQELTISAGSAAPTQEDRSFIAAEIEARYEELLALANTANAAGQYLFSGFKGETIPFEVDGDEVIYHGDNGQRRVQIDHGQAVALNDSGQDVFIDVPVEFTNAQVRFAESETSEIQQVNVVDQAAADAFFPEELVVEFRPAAEAGGETNFTVRRASDNRPVEGLTNVVYPGPSDIEAAGLSFRVLGSPQEGDRFVIATQKTQSVFTTVKDVANGLRDIDEASRPEAFRDMIDRTLVGLQSATQNITRTRLDIGSRYTSIEAAQNLHADLNLQLQAARSDIEDLDFAEAISELSFKSFVLEAAQQSFVRINRLSLFDRL